MERIVQPVLKNEIGSIVFLNFKYAHTCFLPEVVNQADTFMMAMECFYCLFEA